MQLCLTYDMVCIAIHLGCWNTTLDVALGINIWCVVLCFNNLALVLEQ